MKDNINFTKSISWTKYENVKLNVTAKADGPSTVNVGKMQMSPFI